MIIIVYKTVLKFNRIKDDKINILEKVFIDGTFKSVLGLGLTSTIGYGTLFYSFTIMSVALEDF